jgi:hypothetical protein
MAVLSFSPVPVCGPQLEAEVATSLGIAKPSVGYGDGDLLVWGTQVTSGQQSAIQTVINNHVPDPNWGTIPTDWATSTHSHGAGGYELADSHGAVGNGSVDDTVAIQAAIDAASANGNNEVRFSNGKSYRITSQLDWKRGVRLVGGQGYAGNPSYTTEIIAGAPMTRMLYVSDASGGYLSYQRTHDIRYNGNNLADYCIDWAGTAGRMDFGTGAEYVQFRSPVKSGLRAASGVTNVHLTWLRADNCPDYAMEFVHVAGRGTAFVNIDGGTWDNTSPAKGFIKLSNENQQGQMRCRVANYRFENNVAAGAGITEGVFHLIQPNVDAGPTHVLTLDNILMALPPVQRDAFYLIKARRADGTNAVVNNTQVYATGLDLETRFLYDTGGATFTEENIRPLPTFTFVRYDGGSSTRRGWLHHFSPLYFREQTAPPTPGAGDHAFYAESGALKSKSPAGTVREMVPTFPGGTTNFLRSDATWAAPTAAHPDLATHDTLGLATQTELDTHGALTTHHTRAHTVTATADHTFPGGTTTFLRADGTFATPAGGGQAFPIGSIYISVDSTNPATTLGYGTWVAFAAGRTLVGIDATQVEFDTAEETGGAKTHTLIQAEMPNHTHTQQRHGTATGSLQGITTAPDTSSSNPVNMGPNTGGAGSGGAHNNLQPYIVVYMWRRTG